MIAEGYPDDLVPEETPPPVAVPAAVLDAASRYEGLERRSLLWTYALFEAIDRRRLRWTNRLGPNVNLFAFTPTAFFGPPSSISVGFLWDFETESGRPSFGLAIHQSAPRTGSVQIATVQILGLDEWTFPVVLRSGVFEEHQGATHPPDPPGGLATCWGKDGRGNDGVLTAKHNVNGYPIGATIAVGSSTGTVNSKAPNPIDAAFISTSHPIGRVPLAAQMFPAMSTAVSQRTANGYVQNSVASVTHTHGVLNNANFPITVYLQSAAAPGDSGGLVMNPATGEGVAIYRGSLSVPSIGAQGSGGAAGTLGVGQHLFQAQSILGLSLFG